MRLTESKLKEMIGECITEALYKESLVNSVVDNVMAQITEAKKKKKKKKNHKKSDDDKRDSSDRQREELARKALRDNYRNMAEIARKALDPYVDMDDDALRSYASKIARGKRPFPSMTAVNSVIAIARKAI